MTYNHEETKVRDPSAAKEVERLRSEVERLEHENKKLRFINSLRKAAIEVSKWPKSKRDVLR